MNTVPTWMSWDAIERENKRRSRVAKGWRRLVVRKVSLDEVREVERFYLLRLSWAAQYNPTVQLPPTAPVYGDTGHIRTGAARTVPPWGRHGWYRPYAGVIPPRPWPRE